MSIQNRMNALLGGPLSEGKLGDVLDGYDVLLKHLKANKDKKGVDLLQSLMNAVAANDAENREKLKAKIQ